MSYQKLNSKVSLWANTHFSILRSNIKIIDYIEFAITNKLKWLSITDYNNSFGVYEFYFKCIENKIKPIIGIEYFCGALHIIIWAKNKNGVRKIFNISSILNNNNLQDEQKNNKFIEKILKNSNSLIFYIVKWIDNSELKKRITESTKHVYWNNSIYKNNVDNNLICGNIKRMHYLKHSISVKIFDYLRDNQTISLDLIKPLLDKNPQEIYYTYENITNEIIKLIDNYEIEIPNTLNNNQKINSKIRILAHKGLKKRYGTILIKKLHDKLNYEIKVCENLNFIKYIYINYKIVHFINKSRILKSPARGSSAGSLLCYCLYITDIDPIKYNLLFERFINPKRTKLPDIDIDVMDTKRDTVLNYIYSKYSGKAANIITYQKYTLKLIINDILKIFNIKKYRSEVISTIFKIFRKFNINSNSISMADIKLIFDSEEYKKIIIKGEFLDKFYKLLQIYAYSVIGIVRNYSIHPSGIIISDLKIDKYFGTITNDTKIIIQSDMNMLERLNFYKFDILSLINLTTISEIVEEISQHENIKINLNKIKLSQIEPYSLLKSNKTVGIFQIESEGITNLLSKTFPNSIEELSNIIALYRPGPMQFINEYIRNSYVNKNYSFIFNNSKILKLTSKTHSIFIYQEQIMMLFNILADFSLADANLIFYAISKKNKNILHNLYDKFYKNCKINGYSNQEIEIIYNVISKFTNYAFNKAHAVSYSTVIYWMLYLKFYYYKYFLVVMLNKYENDTNKINKIILENKRSQIIINKPTFILSKNKFIYAKNRIISPFNIIRNINKSTIDIIIDIQKQYNSKSINLNSAFIKVFSNIKKDQLVILINSGIFNCIKLNKKSLFKNIDYLITTARLNKSIKHILTNDKFEHTKNDKEWEKKFLIYNI